MNLGKKKQLASKVLKVGKNRIHFASEHLPEIKEAITKQDIKDLVKEGIISIKPIKGRKKVEERKIRRGPGKIKRSVKNRKQIYVKITRKLRKYLKELKTQGRITNELYWALRKRIKMRDFKSKSHLKEYLESLERAKIAKESKKSKPRELKIPEKPISDKTQSKKKLSANNKKKENKEEKKK